MWKAISICIILLVIEINGMSTSFNSQIDDDLPMQLSIEDISTDDSSSKLSTSCSCQNRQIRSIGDEWQEIDNTSTNHYTIYIDSFSFGIIVSTIIIAIILIILFFLYLYKVRQDLYQFHQKLIEKFQVTVTNGIQQMEPGYIVPLQVV